VACGARSSLTQPELWAEGIIAKRAADKAADYAPVIREIQAAGTTSLSGIAAALTERGIPTPGGQGTWQAVQVSRVLARAKLSLPKIAG
jgi:hypothetical protein